MLNVLIVGLILSVVVLFLQIKRLSKQIRVLSAFIAGLSRYSTNSISNVLDISSHEELMGSLEYKKLLNSVEHEFQEDFWITPYEKFLKKDRHLFYEEKMGNGGFNMMYWDFFDKQLSEFKNIKK